MSYIYFAGFKGIIAIDLDRGIVVSPSRTYKGKSTRPVSVQGSLAYILDTKAHLEALGLDLDRMKPQKSAQDAAKPAKARSLGGRYPRKAKAEVAPQGGE